MSSVRAESVRPSAPACASAASPWAANDPDVVLLCVPDTAIADASRRLTPGRAWVGHVSGATPLAALAPHERRFSLHPLQTFDRSGDPSQLDGAWAAITGETGEALAVARELAETLGLRPFELADGDRTLYHAGAVFASNYVVTLQRAAVRLGVPAGGARAADAAGRSRTASS